MNEGLGVKKILYKNFIKISGVRKMYGLLFLIILIMAFLTVTAGYDSQHLRKRTYEHETHPHRALTGRR